LQLPNQPLLLAAAAAVLAQVRAAFALAASSSTIACACAAGTVRMFALRTLAFVANLPRIAPRGQEGAQGGAGPLAQEAFPDALGCSFDAGGKRLAVAYSDRSLHIWDVSNPSQVRLRRAAPGRACWPGCPGGPASSSASAWHGSTGAPRAPLPCPFPQPALRIRSLSAHAASIWDVAPLPAEAALAASAGGTAGAAGASLFATCSSDGSIRVWNISAAAPGRMSLVPGVDDSLGAVKGGRTLAGGDAGLRGCRDQRAHPRPSERALSYCRSRGWG
jgi:hypothetical protein